MTNPLPQRRWLYHAPPDWVKDATYFITICCHTRGVDQLCTPPEIVDQLFAAVAHYHDQQRWYTHLWLLMPDHLHALVACPRADDLAKLIAAWKRHTARHAGIRWQSGFFDHRLRNGENFEEKAAYIRTNPVRKGLVTRPEDWPHVWPR